MTTSTKLSGSSLSPRPPAKGSFPLDHLSECKAFALAYEKCLDEHGRITSKCRKDARAYLQCRMERGLMEVEKWEKLGLSNDRLVKSENIDEAGDLGKRVEEEGFVAGARAAKRRKNRYKKDENGEEGVG